MEFAVVVSVFTSKKGKKREDIGTVPIHWISEDRKTLSWPPSKKEEKNWSAKPTEEWGKHPILKIKFVG